MSQSWWNQAVIYLEEEKKRAVKSVTVSESESEAESDAESNKESGGEEESKGASGSSRAEWSRADK